METFSANSHRQNTHFVREGSSLDCMSHDSQDNIFLDPWYCHEDSYPSLGSSDLLNRLGPIFVEDEPQHAPQHPHSFGSDNLYLPSPPLTGSTFKHTASLPSLCDSPFMGSDLPSRNPLSRILTGSHDVCCRPQPPSPPLDTPELIQRTLPDTNRSEPLSPPLTSPVDIIDLPSLSSFDSPREDRVDLEPELRFCGHDGSGRSGEASSSKRRCCWNDSQEDGADLEGRGHIDCRSHINSGHELLTPISPTWTSSPMLEPLFDDSAMDWTGGASSDHDFTRNLHTPLDPAKQRGNSLDSSQQESYDFLTAMHSSALRPRRRSFTTPPNFPASQPSSPQLDDLWDEPHRMDIDDDALTRSPRSPSLNLNLAGFDDSEMSLMDEEAPMGTYTSALLSASPQPPPLALFDAPPYCGLTDGLASECDFVPSSPHSPHMQLLPSEDDEHMVGADDSPPAMATIAPALLGLPLSTDVGSGGVGLGLDVDPGLDRSPSPSDYELQMLEGHGEVTARDLPEDELVRLRLYYDELAGEERALKEREMVLERRVKDISGLLKPEKASGEATVMRARRQEYRAATELRAEARRARKEEKHRLRELGTLLDLKCETRVFNTKSSIRSVAHLVADMVFKRRDRSRALANRKTAAAPRTSSCSSSSPLRSSFIDEDTTLGEDSDSM